MEGIIREMKNNMATDQVGISAGVLKCGTNKSTQFLKNIFENYINPQHLP